MPSGNTSKDKATIKRDIWKRPRPDFDQAVSVLMQGPVDIHSDERLQREFDKIVDGVHGLEMSALKQGDGFTEQKMEPFAHRWSPPGSHRVGFVDGRGLHLLFGEAVALLQRTHLQAVHAVYDLVEFTLQPFVRMDVYRPLHQHGYGLVEVGLAASRCPA